MTKIFLDFGNIFNSKNEGLQQDYLAKLNGRNPVNVSLAAAIHCDETFYAEVKNVAADLQKKADALLVLGVGGVRAGAKAVVEALDGLPAHKLHCSVLAEEAVKAAVKDYYDKNGIAYDKSKFPDCESCESCRMV